MFSIPKPKSVSLVTYAAFFVLAHQSVSAERTIIDIAADPQMAADQFIVGTGNMIIGKDGISVDTAKNSVFSLYYSDGFDFDETRFGGPNTKTSIALDFVAKGRYSAVGLAYGGINFYFYVDTQNPKEGYAESIHYGVVSHDTKNLQYELGRNVMSDSTAEDFYTQGQDGRIVFILVNDGETLQLKIELFSNGELRHSYESDVTEAGLKAAPIAIKGYAPQLGAVFKKLTIVESKI